QLPRYEGGVRLGGDDDTTTPLETSPDGERGFVLCGPIGAFSNVKDKLLVLDLEQRRAVGAVNTGRGGKECLRTMSRGLANMAGGFMHVLMFGYPEDVASAGGLAVRRRGLFACALDLTP